ncbi:MAG: NAD(P) transhydrogenase subunit alpha [Demequinaceae bacterium]|nr:NAD(P) transhydrogenase subunit alpha [Demequinaceae bacterium]
MPVSVAALVERAPGEKRVALVPEVVAKLVSNGFSVMIESGAGEHAFFSDSDYKKAGAKVVSAAEALKATIILSVNRPPTATVAKLTKGQFLIGQLRSLVDAKDLETAAAKGVTVISLDRLPRQVSRAQTMDVLSSQASVAGYRALIAAAEAFSRYFPMMMTAAGTARPAKVLVLGAGVAGLQAIGTARRMGAQVSGYDVRPAAREEVASMGAQFLETSVESAVGEGGYARALTKEETARQQKELSVQIAKFDIVITTANVPGRKPPILVTKETVAAMAPGSVIVDTASGPLGGNVEGSVSEKRVVTKNNVIIIGSNIFAAQMPSAASTAFAKNMTAVLDSIYKDGQIVIDPDDEVIEAMLIPAALKGVAK